MKKIVLSMCLAVIVFVGAAQIKKGGVYAYVDSLKNGYIIWFENDTVLSLIEICNTNEMCYYGSFSWSKKDTRRLIEETSKWEKNQSPDLRPLYRGEYRVKGNNVSFYPKIETVIHPITLEIINRKRLIMSGETYNYVLSVK